MIASALTITEETMASNPAFNRIDQDARSGYAGFGPSSTGADQTTYPGGVYSQPGAPIGRDQLEQMYGAPSASPVDTGRVTIDDVIMKSMSLFGIVLVLGAVGWFTAASNPGLGLALTMGGMVGTLILGLVIAFKKTLSVPLIIGYAALEGLFIGAVSQFYEARYGGIVGQAVLATLATFAGMLAAYKFGVIKVTDKFRRIVTTMIFGYAIFAVVNVIFALFTKSAFGFGGSGALGIAISLFAVGLAAFTLALDFDSIDYAIRTGAPKQYGWLLAHGLIVTLVWLYLEFLRLLGRLRN